VAGQQLFGAEGFGSPNRGYAIPAYEEFLNRVG
jgi:hypothetical protein